MASLTQMLNLIFRRVEKKKMGVEEMVNNKLFKKRFHCM
jgi:hypothetical protein